MDTLRDVTGEHILSFRIPQLHKAAGWNAWCTACGETFKTYDEALATPCVPRPDDKETER
jgi:hypothetical protein